MPETKENIWIIGASCGIGAELAIEYSKTAHVIISARSEDKLEEVSKSLHNEHLVRVVDICQTSSIQAALNFILGKWHKIDRVILMAGAYQPMQLGHLDLAVARNIIETNFIGTVNVIETLLPGMSAFQLAICASVAGYFGLPNSQPYAASKAAVISLTESLKSEYSNVDVRLINPGFVATRLTEKNKFKMPMIISSKRAAKYIIAGLAGNSFEIHFPKSFSLIMKLIAILPYALMNRLNNRLTD